MRNNLIWKIAGLILTILVIADYFQLFGYVVYDGIKPLPFSFVVKEESSGEVLHNVDVKFILDNGRVSELNLKLHENDGVIEGYVGVFYGGTRTILFDKCKLKSVKGKEFHFQFSKPGYQSYTQTVVYEALDKKGIIQISKDENFVEVDGDINNKN